jgi:light-regulated signal transduction histidine kinase (bacteriophytochrome)
LRKADGTPARVMLGSHIDITEKIAIQMELHKRNQKLMKFAFSNAHHVRGPVARMLGLVELVKIDTETDRQWYVQTISNEVQELDKITKSIARELDEIEELS